LIAHIGRLHTCNVPTPAQPTYLHTTYTPTYPTLTLTNTSVLYKSTLQTYANLHTTYIPTLQKPPHPTYAPYSTYLHSPTCLPYPHIPTKHYNPYPIYPTLHARPTPAHLLNEHVVRRYGCILPVIRYYVFIGEIIACECD